MSGVRIFSRTSPDRKAVAFRFFYSIRLDCQKIAEQKFSRLLYNLLGDAANGQNAAEAVRQLCNNPYAKEAAAQRYSLVEKVYITK